MLLVRERTICIASWSASRTELVDGNISGDLVSSVISTPLVLDSIILDVRVDMGRTKVRVIVISV